MGWDLFFLILPPQPCEDSNSSQLHGMFYMSRHYSKYFSNKPYLILIESVTCEVRLSDLTTEFHFLSAKEVFLYGTKRIIRSATHAWECAAELEFKPRSVCPCCSPTPGEIYGLLASSPTQHGLSASSPAPHSTQLGLTSVPWLLLFICLGNSLP